MHGETQCWVITEKTSNDLCVPFVQDPIPLIILYLKNNLPKEICPWLYQPLRINYTTLAYKINIKLPMIRIKMKGKGFPAYSKVVDKISDRVIMWTFREIMPNITSVKVKIHVVYVKLNCIIHWGDKWWYDSSESVVKRLKDNYKSNSNYPLITTLQRVY